MKTPGDWIGWGWLVILGGAIVGGVLAGASEEPLLALAGVPVALVGGFMLQIGVIGWGVALGIGHAAQRSAPPHAVPVPRQLMQQQDPTLPPGDQPEWRSYR